MGDFAQATSVKKVQYVAITPPSFSPCLIAISLMVYIEDILYLGTHI